MPPPRSAPATGGWPIASTCGDAIVVVNKVDRATPAQIGEMLARRVGARRRRLRAGVGSHAETASTALEAELAARLPEGPQFFPPDTVRDVPDEEWIAELVREQLLAVTRDELPYSIATQVTEWEGNRVRVDIVVERESQKAMVIGKGGAVLKEAGQRARAQLPPGLYLELRVKVDKNWQRRPDRVQRLGY